VPRGPLSCKGSRRVMPCNSQFAWGRVVQIR
jgi:hypothetical protein